LGRKNLGGPEGVVFPLFSSSNKRINLKQAKKEENPFKIFRDIDNIFEGFLDGFMKGMVENEEKFKNNHHRNHHQPNIHNHHSDQNHISDGLVVTGVKDVKKDENVPTKKIENERIHNNPNTEISSNKDQLNENNNKTQDESVHIVSNEANESTTNGSTLTKIIKYSIYIIIFIVLLVVAKIILNGILSKGEGYNNKEEDKDSNSINNVIDKKAELKVMKENKYY